MEANVPDRDELGRFTAWAKKKGGEAIDSIRKGAASSLQNIGKGANLAADAVAPVEAPDEAEDKQDPSVGVANAMLDGVEPKNLMMKRKVRTVPTGPAKKPSYKPWNMEKTKGW